jgi:hypothetical protein
MSWFRVSAGRLEYRGTITREPFTRWTRTTDGRAAISRVAAALRFSLFGRKYAARRRLWRSLESAARTRSGATAIAAEAPRFMQVVSRLAYSEGLPRAVIALHRLVVVPRAMIASHARVGLSKRLCDVPELAELDDAVQIFLCDQLVAEMDGALQKASASPRKPVAAHDEWTCVGVSKGIEWVDPMWAGPDGTGHVFMYEFPRAGLSRKDRKTLESAIAEMSVSLSSLSKLQRNAMVRAASARP